LAIWRSLAQRLYTDEARAERRQAFRDHRRTFTHLERSLGIGA
jgi:hypothetical protein